jgi:hypothetical protein
LPHKTEESFTTGINMFIAPFPYRSEQIQHCSCKWE